MWNFDARQCVTALAFVAIALASGISIGAVAKEQNASQPTLADLMTLTQLRHFKLWYAHKMANWKLTGYELDQFENTIERIVKLYPRVSSISQANLIHEKTDPAMSEIRRAIHDKNNSRFESAYKKITSACNECHKAAGFSFIVVQVPTKSPFSNQNFEPTH
jgi:hypothetical protein